MQRQSFRFRTTLTFCVMFGAIVCSTNLTAAELTPQQITETWKTGKTLPKSVFDTYRLPPARPIQNNTGINILVDLNRECRFVWLWNYQNQFTQNGFRVASTQATLDTVLGDNPQGRVRVRTECGEPFAWWTPPDFNVVIVQAGRHNQQQFLTEEIETLKKFVQEGGGLIIISSTPPTEPIANSWSFNTLLAAFDAQVLARAMEGEFGRAAVLQLSEDWEPMLELGERGIIRAQRAFGLGRVLILEHELVLCAPNLPAGQHNEETRQTEEQTLARQAELIRWAAGGKEPVGRNVFLPQTRAGGGGIFPDQELNLDGLVVYYAKNQSPELMQVVKDDVPKAHQILYSLLPSEKPEEPMMFILSAGSGGGWAVNARLPREVGIISDSRFGIIEIFAHEQAHTMRGPRNVQGGYGAKPAHDLSGEAHAGWFQGKAKAHFDETDRERSNRNANNVLNDRERFQAYDFAQHFGRHGDSFGWSKLWWVWQKLDDRYGPTWYPRWYWVRATRWAEQPDHQQTWDETIEDMSIAVGEDLFPFFKAIGTTLGKDRFAQAEFQGATLTLPVAEIEITPGGNVNLTPVGDYTKPLR